MSETQTQDPAPGTPGGDPHEFDLLAQQVADATEVFLLGLQEISRGESAESAVPLLLLEVSQLLLAGAQLGRRSTSRPARSTSRTSGPTPTWT